MRRVKVWPPVPMRTAKNGEYDDADTFAIGADDYLTTLFRPSSPPRPVAQQAATSTPAHH